MGVGRHQLPQVESKPLRFNCELDAARCCKSVFRTPVIVTCKDSGAHERLYRSAMKTSGGSGEEWPSDSSPIRGHSWIHAALSAFHTLSLGTCGSQDTRTCSDICDKQRLGPRQGGPSLWRPFDRSKAKTGPRPRKCSRMGHRSKRRKRSTCWRDVASLRRCVLMCRTDFRCQHIRILTSSSP